MTLRYPHYRHGLDPHGAGSGRAVASLRADPAFTGLPGPAGTGVLVRAASLDLIATGGCAVITDVVDITCWSTWRVEKPQLILRRKPRTRPASTALPHRSRIESSSVRNPITSSSCSGPSPAATFCGYILTVTFIPNRRRRSYSCGWTCPPVFDYLLMVDCLPSCGMTVLPVRWTTTPLPHHAVLHHATGSLATTTVTGCSARMAGWIANYAVLIRTREIGATTVVADVAVTER